MKVKRTKAGNLTSASFAKTDETFLAYCKEHGLKPTKTRARKYKRRLK